MKIAILADIHGNRQALETVMAHIDNWQPDHVIVNGDTVNRGPCSLECWQTVSERVAQDGWQHTLGNHEVYQLDILENGFKSELERQIFLPLLKAHQQLEGCVPAFSQLPTQLSLYAPDGSELRVTHASMNGQRDSIFEDSSLPTLREQIAPSPAVFVTSHTHITFQRQVDETLLVNTGSVGTPADQDVRASYAQVVWENGRWHAKTIRLDYDREGTIRDYKESRFLSDDDFFIQLVFKEWHDAYFYVYKWMDLYYDEVKAGKIGLETAVTHYLNTLQK
ncbi:MAG: metallophosphoesterase family protein [Anaerolineae bacterium]|nr:metallophosphoesterase family protein [Anaerolineae bacterium]